MLHVANMYLFQMLSFNIVHLIRIIIVGALSYGYLSINFVYPFYLIFIILLLLTFNIKTD
jgi:hypothetical protein